MVVVGEKTPRPVINLNPEEAKQVILQFSHLPSSRKNQIKSIMHNACASCESELNVAPTAISHGICPRHYSIFLGGDEAPPAKPGRPYPIDLSTMSKEDIDIASKITAIRREHAKSGKEKMTEGRAVCAWCKKDMGERPDIDGITHGVCPDCLEKNRAHLQKIKPKTNPLVN